jgi:hypothetical protein
MRLTKKNQASMTMMKTEQQLEKQQEEEAGEIITNEVF